MFLEPLPYSSINWPSTFLPQVCTCWAELFLFLPGTFTGDLSRRRVFPRSGDFIHHPVGVPYGRRQTFLDQGDDAPALAIHLLVSLEPWPLRHRRVSHCPIVNREGECHMDGDGPRCGHKHAKRRPRWRRLFLRRRTAVSVKGPGTNHLSGPYEQECFAQPAVATVNPALNRGSTFPIVGAPILSAVFCRVDDRAPGGGDARKRKTATFRAYAGAISDLRYRQDGSRSALHRNGPAQGEAVPLRVGADRGGRGFSEPAVSGADLNADDGRRCRASGGHDVATEGAPAAEIKGSAGVGHAARPSISRNLARVSCFGNAEISSGQTERGTTFRCAHIRIALCDLFSFSATI